jgi:hypothetical protein
VKFARLALAGNPYTAIIIINIFIVSILWIMKYLCQGLIQGDRGEFKECAEEDINIISYVFLLLRMSELK